MPPFGPTSRRALVGGLGKLGFEGPFSGGKHEFMIRGSTTVRIPNPHGRDIGVGLLARVLRQAGVSAEEWESV